MALDVRREGGEVAQLLVQDPLEDAEIDLEVAVHQDVPETGDVAEAGGKIRGQCVDLDETVDGACVVRSVQTRRSSQVRRDVQGVLGAELEAALDRPSQIGVGAQRLELRTPVALEVSQRRSQGKQMPAQDRGVRTAASHDPEPLRARRPAISIFAS